MGIAKKTLLTLAGVLVIGGGIGAAYGFGGHGRMGGWHGPMGGWRGHGGFGGPMMHLLARADANGDGEITKDEIKAVRDDRFAKFDLNADGVVDEEEIRGVVLKRIERRVKRHITRITRRFDHDRDGKVTKAEFDRFAEERFFWHDLNDDGKISGDEMPRWMRWALKRHRGPVEE